MVLVVVAVVVVVLAAVVLWALRRRNSDEVHSVDGYRHTIETLQGMRSPSGVRVLGGPDSGDVAAPAPERLHPPVGPIGSHAIPPPPRAYGSEGPLVFEDATLRDGDGSREPRGGQRTQMRAMSAMNHRPRRLAAPIAVAAVVVVVAAGLAYVGARSGSHHSTPPAPTVPSSGSHGSSNADSQHGSTTKGTTKTTTAKGTTHATTTTTTTAPPAFNATSSTATTASYTMTADDYTVTIAATTGNCWVQVRSVATGSSPLAMTLTPGQQQTVKLSGINTLLLGAPSAAKVTISSEPVVLPTGYGVPFTMTFNPPTT